MPPALICSTENFLNNGQLGGSDTYAELVKSAMKALGDIH